MTDDLITRARFAAEILVATWRELGSDPATYDLVWCAKEYLYDAADFLTPTIDPEAVN